MELRQNFVDVPLSEVEETLCRALYPAGHPYRRVTIGSAADLSEARLPEISAFFQRYYAPNNAFLCIAGDFRPAVVRRWVQKYFGGLPPSISTAAPESNLTAPVQSCHLSLTDRISHATTYLVWKTVPAHHPDEPAIDVLASILGGEARGSRLFRALIDDRQLALDASASHPTLMLAGQFELYLVASDGQKLEELVRVADGEIERLKQEGPTDEEVRRAKLQRRNWQMQRLEPVTRQAEILNYDTATTGNPLAYRSELLKLFAVTPADVVRVAPVSGKRAHPA